MAPTSSPAPIVIPVKGYAAAALNYYKSEGWAEADTTVTAALSAWDGNHLRAADATALRASLEAFDALQIREAVTSGIDPVVSRAASNGLRAIMRRLPWS